MTLFKAVEAARDDFKNVDGTLIYIETQLKGSLIHSDVVIRMNAESGRRRIKSALAALPAEPKSEEELYKMVIQSRTTFSKYGSYCDIDKDAVLDTIRFLKTADCLYVKED